MRHFDKALWIIAGSHSTQQSIELWYKKRLPTSEAWEIPRDSRRIKNASRSEHWILNNRLFNSFKDRARVPPGRPLITITGHCLRPCKWANTQSLPPSLRIEKNHLKNSRHHTSTFPPPINSQLFYWRSLSPNRKSKLLKHSNHWPQHRAQRAPQTIVHQLEGRVNRPSYLLTMQRRASQVLSALSSTELSTCCSDAGQVFQSSYWASQRPVPGAATISHCITWYWSQECRFSGGGPMHPLQECTVQNSWPMQCLSVLIWTQYQRALQRDRFTGQTDSTTSHQWPDASEPWFRCCNTVLKQCLIQLIF